MTHGQVAIEITFRHSVTGLHVFGIKYNLAIFLLLFQKTKFSRAKCLVFPAMQKAKARISRPLMEAYRIASSLLACLARPTVFKIQFNASCAS